MQTETTHLLRRDGIALVFCMEWFPLLGGHAERQARSFARRHRATHRVICLGAASAVGLLRARLPRSGKQRYCSAAAAFAVLHPAGTVAAVLQLPDERYWLIAVHEGAVMTRTDQVHAEPSQVHDAIRLLREAHPGLVLHDESREPSGLLDALFEVARDRAELTQAPRFAGVAVPTLMALLAGIGGAALAIVGGLFPHERGNGIMPPGNDLAAWQTAVMASAQHHKVHGVAGLQALLDTLYALPVGLAGWRLVEAECRPQASQWQCHARYRRQEGADNRGLIASAQADWVLSFDPMDGALASWSVPMPALSLAALALRRSRENETQLLSSLQSMLPAFSEFRLEAPQALPLRVPLDTQQRPIARPPGIAGYQRRMLRMQAPLRSLSLLLPETIHMSWDRVLLQVSAAVDRPSLRSSSLRVSLSGMLYEIDDIDPPVSRSSDARIRAGSGDSHPGAAHGA